MNIMQPQNGTPKSMINVLLVESGQIMRTGLKMLLEKNNSIKVVREFEAALPFPIKTQGSITPIDTTDVIVFSPTANCLEGIAKITELRELLPNAKVLLLAKGSNQMAMQKAVMLGASGIVYHKQTGEVLVQAVEKVFKGEIWIDRMLMAQTLNDFTAEKVEKRDHERQKIDSLTPREKQMICSIGEGMSNKEITKNLSISESTVRHHLSSIYSKLEVKDRLGLVIYAYKFGLIKIIESRLSN
jgi:DNA-binding NarL/FixJ family response regulator